ncbi:MAG TPA: hypothetical protein VFT22_21875, partial [Kofleriaceae bacterium]|nr:hypothetical protein [Kofleriaceae bacterium]
MCGASAVLFDLDLALADRSSRHHTLELLHRIAKASWTYERVETEFERDRVVRNLQRGLPAALDEFLRGQASHREQSILRVRSQVEAIQDRGPLEGARLRGTSTTDLEALFPVETYPEDVVARILETAPAVSLEKRRASFLGLVNPQGSPRR